ncbi:MAG: zinc ribbon domain-containing protein, partial [Nannocystaceae bacterium]|nr:zinc ribbon domain-containing protein [Nannocystaceae bacterium]
MAGPSSCASCGAEHRPTDNFCANCGSRLRKAPQEAPCRECGVVVPIGARFCVECGASEPHRVIEVGSDDVPTETRRKTGEAARVDDDAPARPSGSGKPATTPIARGASPAKPAAEPPRTATRPPTAA